MAEPGTAAFGRSIVGDQDGAPGQHDACEGEREREIQRDAVRDGGEEHANSTSGHHDRVLLLALLVPITARLRNGGDQRWLIFMSAAHTTIEPLKRAAF